MAVEMDHRNRSISTVDGPKEREGDGVVTTKSNDSRQGPALDCWTPLVRVSGWSARKDVEVSLFDLMKGPGVVISVSM